MDKHQDLDASIPPGTGRSYVSDEPVGIEADLLNRAPFARAIADLIEHIDGDSSTVIAIYGEWGDGKTSVLNMIEGTLKQVNEIECRRFNPWRFQDEDAQLRELFGTIGKAADARLVPGQQVVGKLLQRLAPLLKGVKFEAGPESGGASVSPGDAAAAIADELVYQSIEDLRLRISKHLRQSVRKVVILIDDVDRLDRHEMQTLMRVLKLSCDFSNTVYVLACDEAIVAASIGERYGAGDPGAGYAFLEKIVQVPLRLPMPDRLALIRANIGFLWSVLERAELQPSPEEWQRFLRYYRIALEPAVRTLRAGKRYANSVCVTLPLVQDHVNLVDFLLIEGVRVFYPKLHAEIRANLSLFVEPRENGPPNAQDMDAIRATMARALANVPAEQHSSLRQLTMALFPHAGAALGGTQYGRGFSDGWTREKRVTSKRYSSRYFALQVPLTDVRDSDINGILAQVGSGELDGATEALRNLLTGANAESVVERLWERVPQLESGAAGEMAVVIARIAEQLPEEPGAFYSTSDRAAIAVRQLIGRIKTDAARFQWAQRVLVEAGTVSFAVECGRGLAADDEGADEVLVAEDKVKLRSLLVDRIRSELRRSIYELPEWPRLTSLIAGWSWWGDRDEQYKFFGEILERNPDNATRILMAYSGRGVDGFGVARPGRMMGDGYDAMCKSVDPAAMESALRKLHGELLERDGADEEGSEVSDSLRLARVFTRIHKVIKAGSGEGDQEPGETVEPPPLENESPAS